VRISKGGFRKINAKKSSGSAQLRGVEKKKKKEMGQRRILEDGYVWVLEGKIPSKKNSATGNYRRGGRTKSYVPGSGRGGRAPYKRTKLRSHEMLYAGGCHGIQTKKLTKKKTTCSDRKK